MNKAKMRFATVKSPLETLEGKYTGLFIHNGVDGLDEIAARIVRAHPNVGVSEVKLAVRALAAEIRACVADGPGYAGADGLAGFTVAISGSVASLDAPLTPGENAIYVNIVALEPLREAIGALVPVAASDETAAVAITDVEGKALRKHGVISTPGAFTVTGKNLSAGGEDEGITLANASGDTVATATVTSEDGLGQRIDASFAAAVPAGTYKLILKSHGYATATGPLETVAKRVVVA